MQADMLEAVVAKADATLARYYAGRLTNADQQQLTEDLVQRLRKLTDDLLALTGDGELLAGDRQEHDSIIVRNTYLDPLHLLQAELLVRRRSGRDSQAVSQALKVNDGRHCERVAQHRLVGACAVLPLYLAARPRSHRTPGHNASKGDAGVHYSSRQSNGARNDEQR